MHWMKFLMHLGHSIEEGHSFILRLSLWNSLELFSATQATPLKGIMDIRLRFPLFLIKYENSMYLIGRFSNWNIYYCYYWLSFVSLCIASWFILFLFVWDKDNCASSHASKQRRKRIHMAVNGCKSLKAFGFNAGLVSLILHGLSQTERMTYWIT